MTEPISEPSWIDLIVPPHGTVTGQFVAVSYDSADADSVPDVQPLSGTVRLTPTVTAGRVNDAFAHIRPVTLRIFGGQIVDDEDKPGARILSTDADLGVEDWAWTAQIQLDDGPRLKPFPFKLPTGETVSLSSGLVPVESAPYQIVQGAPGESAYEVAVRHGYTGTEAEWLESLKGDGSAWADITGKPDSFPSTVPDVQGLAARLAALEYDSGWRVLTSWDGSGTRVGDWTFPSGVAPTPGSSGSVRIRRVRRRVEWLFHGCSWSANAVLFNSEIPAGFRTGDTEWIAPLVVGLTPADLGTLRRRTWGFYINDASGKASHTTYGTHFGYETNEPIPTTLPGTPA